MFEKERYLLVKITDSSGGMGQDSVSSLFARRPLSAKNISQDKATEDGSLMIAKSLVDAHGGRIWAESQLGSATTLFLLLPTKSPFSKTNPDK
jgi:signal transduction histidine kinase